jgi:hypothetical protein
MPRSGVKEGRGSGEDRAGAPSIARFPRACLNATRVAIFRRLLTEVTTDARLIAFRTVGDADHFP